LDDDIADQIAEVLKQFGYDPEGDRIERRSDATARNATPATGGYSVFRETNDTALANLDCWVPGLGLYKHRRKPGGYEAVATWRPSCSGRPREKRKRNLSIVSEGIRDFGEGRTYSPVDLVMAARELDKLAALNWLLSKLPQEPLIILRK
jgi:hypothetical protein